MAKTGYRMIAGSGEQENICSGPSSDSDALIINEAQLILAEKRTSMAAIRHFAILRCAARSAADRTAGRHAPGIDRPWQLSDPPGVVEHPPVRSFDPSIKNVPQQAVGFS